MIVGDDCGHIAIFSQKGKGIVQDIDVDCTAAVNALPQSGPKPEIAYFCVFDGWLDTVTTCDGLITTPPELIKNWSGERATRAAHKH